MSRQTLSMISIVLGFLGRCSTSIAEEPSLDDLLKQYKALGLPLPPKEAKLVRFESGGGGIIYQKIQPRTYRLAFLLKTETDKENAVILDGTNERWPSWKIHATEMKPDPKLLGDLAEQSDCLPLALQCHVRGWDDLARHLLEKVNKDETDPVRNQLIRHAWDYWWEKVTDPEIDRVPLAKRLHEIIRLDNAVATEYDREVLKSLDAALIPSKAKPGSIEAFIDDLVNYGSSSGTIGIFEHGERYERIAKLGFDAVPQLIEHLDDDRLTRSATMRFNNFLSWHRRVGDVVTDLLEDLAGEATGRSWVRHENGYRPEKAEVLKWWETAQKVGEEAYLLQHVLPPLDKKGARLGIPAIRLIGIKYPKKLPAIYREVLEKRPQCDTQDLSAVVMKIALPLKEKLDLFTIAAKHKDYEHRVRPLYYLSELDKQLFTKLLTASIEDLPKDVTAEYWSCGEVRVAHLILRTDDANAWQVLEKAAARASLGLKMELLNLRDYSREVQHRMKRLHLLATYLDDSTLRDEDSDKRFHGPGAGFPYDKIEVRNFVALKMAYLLGIEVKLDFERKPAQWAKIRNHVREAAEREFGKEKKP